MPTNPHTREAEHVPDTATPAALFAAAIVRPLMRGDIHSLDGFDLQDMAVKAGLLAPVEVLEPCGGECACAQFGADFPTTCYRLTEAGKALPDAP